MAALIILSILGVLVLMMGLFHVKNKSLLVIIPVLLGMVYLNSNEWSKDAIWFSGMLKFDNFALAFSSLIIVVSVLWFILCHKHYTENFKAIEDTYALLLFSLVGGICLVSYHNLTMLFLGIEILSIPLYILAGSNRNNYLSNEASLKYFLMGAFASAIMLFGIAMIYGATNSFDLHEISLKSGQPYFPGLFYTGIALTLCGFLFKVGAAPFHFWVPDVYQGSPSLITGFMATIVKVSAFAALYRFLNLGIPGLDEIWINSIAIIAVLTLFVGNLSAIQQTDFKRLMAYSGISHAGYMLIAILVNGEGAADALFFYATSYALTSVGAFAIFLNVKKYTGEYSIESLRGLVYSAPLQGVCLILLLFSMAGIPPLGGFFAKYFVLIGAVKSQHIYVVVFAVINTVIGAYYYLRVVNTAIASPAFHEKKIRNSALYEGVIVFVTLASLLLGILPGQLTGILN